MAVKINGTTGIETNNLTASANVTTADITNTGNYNGGYLSNRNLIINGAMQIAQRGTSATNVTTNGYATVDRFAVEGAATKSFDLSLGTGPEGFANSFKYSRVNSTTLDTNDYVLCIQAIEGQNLQQLKYGTANAESITVSFWVKSTATGSYALNIYANDSGAARSVTKTYSIDIANTWEYKTITFSGDQAGQINNDNGHGLWFQWWLRAGSAYTSTLQTQWGPHSAGAYAGGHTADFMSANNGSWEITGVQVEVGETATPFEHRSYGQELALCQRYYEIVSRYSGASDYGTIWSQPLDTFSNCWTPVRYAVPKRAAPSWTDFSGVTWSGGQPVFYLNSTEAAVLQRGGYFYQGGGGGNPGSPMSAVDAEL